MLSFNPFGSGMRQLLVPAVFLTLAPNVQSLTLNARNFLISEPILLLLVLLLLLFFFFLLIK